MILKMVSWLGKTVAAGLIVSFLSIWTTGYVVNSYVETLLKQFNIPLEMKPIAMDGVWGALWGADPAVKPKADLLAADARKGDGGRSEDDGQTNDGEKDASASTRTEASSGGSGSAEATGSDAASAEGGGSEGDQAGETSASGEPLAVDAYGELPDGIVTDVGGGTGTKANSGATSEDGGSALGDAQEGGVAMTTEEMSEAKSRISTEDKNELFDVMMKKLPQEAWQSISAMMENGLTEQEMTDVQQLFAQHLNREEYDRMTEILSKY
ncbi:hypothetical protein ACFFSY_11895 [Paenibacillus aurantiacus]|uniref:Spore coat protein n=1 Tax=Paenibacillus aurantiacus TaxID=1936118 RepID=A0ABV5KN27_9BACL